MARTARIIRIGNSQGVRIPKPLLEQSGIHEQVEIEVQPGRIILHAAQPVRAGWGEAFRDMAARGDDALLDGDQLEASSWDEEWQW